MIQIMNRQRRVRLSPESIEGLRAAASLTLERLGVPERPVAVVLVSDRAMRRLNLQFRGKDQPTNVLSFPEDEDDLGGGPMPVIGPEGESATSALEPSPLGDVILSLETAQREAKTAQGTGADLGREDEALLFDRLVTLLIHGLLHLVGYDHQDDAQEEEMERLSKDIRIEFDSTFHRA